MNVDSDADPVNVLKQSTIVDLMPQYQVDFPRQ